MEIVFMLLFAYLRKVRDTRLRQMANAVAAQANTAADRAKGVIPMTVK